MHSLQVCIQAYKIYRGRSLDEPKVLLADSILFFLSGRDDQCSFFLLQLVRFSVALEY
jgi:hypothetical protein